MYFLSCHAGTVRWLPTRTCVRWSSSWRWKPRWNPCWSPRLLRVSKTTVRSTTQATCCWLECPLQETTHTRTKPSACYSNDSSSSASQSFHPPTHPSFSASSHARSTDLLHRSYFLWDNRWKVLFSHFSVACMCLQYVQSWQEVMTLHFSKSYKNRPLFNGFTFC